MSSALSITNQLFFDRTELNEALITNTLRNSLSTANEGEVFLEYKESESFVLDDGIIKSTNFDTTQGFGVRAVAGDLTGYAHTSTFSADALKRAAVTASTSLKGYQGAAMIAAAPHPLASLYCAENPLHHLTFEAKINLLQQIDHYLRTKDPRVHQVSASLVGSWQAISILKPNGARYNDIRPLVRLNISVVVQQNGRLETGTQGGGGRSTYEEWVKPSTWHPFADEALRQALINLEARPAPAGELPVVLGPGWPGILLHEAIGHGLEGDFNRKKTSAFSNMIGKRVAAPGVTVVDDGTMVNRRGSLNLDDEGNPTNRTTLIEDGILVGYLQDQMNSRLMNGQSTGNGRRQSYAHTPMPRMTNTVMLNGTSNPDEIIGSVKRGLYAVNFDSGQVDITSGKFVFSASEAYMIENGKISYPVKGATLIGNGPDVLTKVEMIGNDMALDAGVGTCGKDGQSVPVGVGQPTLLIGGLTVGGTEV